MTAWLLTWLWQGTVLATSSAIGRWAGAHGILPGRLPGSSLPVLQEVTPNEACARVTTIGAQSNVLIDKPSGTRPGFLSSVAEIRRLAARTLPYIYGDRLYELRLLDATPPEITILISYQPKWWLQVELEIQ